MGLAPFSLLFDGWLTLPEQDLHPLELSTLLGRTPQLLWGKLNAPWITQAHI